MVQKKSFGTKTIGILVLTMLSLATSGRVCSQEIRYSPQWFGPNAHPVPRMQMGLVTDKLRIAGDVDFTLNREDQTQSLYLDIDIPLIPKALSMRIYGCALEHYNVSSRIAESRGMPMDKLAGMEGGDYYIQTKIKLLSEKKGFYPNLVFHSTLKTAAADQVRTRRYFDTPGYFFHLEAGKNLLSTSWSGWKQLRITLMGGFMCWETSGSLQNDAYLYGIQTAFYRTKWMFWAELSGYGGWMSKRYGDAYGDKPIVFRLGTLFRLRPEVQIKTRYEQGIRHFPYQQISIGLQWLIPCNIRWN